VKASASVGQWEKLLNCSYFYYSDEHPISTKDELTLRTPAYHLPKSLVGHVDTIFHTVHRLPHNNPRHHNKPGSAYRVDSNVRLADNVDDYDGMKAVTVEYLNGFYEIPTGPTASPTSAPSTCPSPCPTSCAVGHTAAFINEDSGCVVYCVDAPANGQCQEGGSGCTSSCVSMDDIGQAVFETNSESFSQTDLTQFQTYFDLNVQAAVDIGGTEVAADECSFDNCGEGSLDIQYIMGISPHTVSTFYYVGGSDPIVTFVTDLADDSNPPKSNSISWGSIEQGLSASVLNSFNTEAMKLGAIGVTVTASSGDGGVSNGNCACTQNSGSSQSLWSGAGTWSGEGYFPNFPASNPYITAVGATMGPEGEVPTERGTEIVSQTELNGNLVSAITSGGGFSTYFAQPAWQTTVITNYFNELTTLPAAGYNKNGRGLPDVSFLGIMYLIVVNGTIAPVYGTSCSSPVTAGMISIINAKRVAHGLTTVGFINPTLYANTVGTRMNYGIIVPA
jgi:hypothetical protein